MNHRHALSAALALAAVLTLGYSPRAQIAAETAADDDEPSRYALEFIVFRYDASVTAGTEVFLPDLPSLPELPPESSADIVAPTDRLGARRGLDEAGVRRREDVSSFARALPADPGFDNATAGDVPTFGDAQAPLEPGGDTPTAIAPFGDDDLAGTELAAFRARHAVDIRLIPPDLLSMTDVHEKLLLLDAYDPVLWSGWTQIVVDEAFSPAISLRRLGNPPNDIDGTLTLYLGRFVHLVTDLTWSIPDQRSGPARPGTSTPAADVPYFGDRDANFGYFDRRNEPDTVYIRYRIAEDRIMRNGDTRYFDHPRFGLIAKLTLVEPGSPLDPKPRPEVIPASPDAIQDEPSVLPADDSSVLQPAAPPQ